MYDADDIVDLKNRKRRRKRLRRFILILLAAAIGTGLYFTRDMWYNKLRGIGEQYRTIVNSGELAEGNFPIEVSAADYQLEFTDRKMILLSDTYTYFYDSEGKLLKRRQHTYTNSVLRSAGGRALLYENGGNDLSIEDEDEVFYTKTYAKKLILFARISEQGFTAVVTTSDNYCCELEVYDKRGKVIYGRQCIEMVSDLSFINNSKGCVLSFISAENGQLVTNVQEISFSENVEHWTSPGLNTLGLDVYGYGKGAFVLGTDACGYVDSNGQISSYYSYDGDLVAGASEDGNSAVIVNNDDRRKYIVALFKGGNTEALIIDLEEPSIDVTIYEDLAYVMCQGKIKAYDFSGGLRSVADVSDSYTGFVRSDDHIFLKGYNKIDRIDYES
ncbi:DUF5711 family protein [Ruminococcus flavefaciens]|uniref:DUF5711 family protein n=1 Tax=Ruminococcus flavefaciens TaxID=1265 RepID=UPI0026EB61A2|nr:DUF5711 family protein [Ruminococcus flavefaciens]MDD7517309.1 DUF5711 family protein [Ruminococcus flavefaciens]MDY5690840.1 DUF5711 family protein [Ruminococcus flavefaciens]